MSIHKSKGLEFPVVFLCGTGKQFNVQDLNQNILLHQDIGFGPTYINYERKIEYNTLAKEAIKVKMKNEILSEEMRLLYVALTRAKEKLIITGVKKKVEETSIELGEGDKIPSSTLKMAKSYLDWLEMIHVANEENIKDVIEIEYHGKEDVLNIINVKEKAEKPDIEELINNKEFNSDKYKRIDELLGWKYPNSILTKIEGKSSVSKISKEQEYKKEYIDISKKPKFLSESIKLTQAEIGTAMHLILQKIDFNIEYDETKIKELVEELFAKHIITNNEKESIDINRLIQFTNSNMFSRIKLAKKIFKEQPFYINIPAKEIYDEDIKENVLVQGIIDLYFIDKDDEIVLIDYKTDYVKSGEEELVRKYRKQLEIYKRAIESATKVKVKEAYIYSTYLDKSILIK